MTIRADDIDPVALALAEGGPHLGGRPCGMRPRRRGAATWRWTALYSWPLAMTVGRVGRASEEELRALAVGDDDLLAVRAAVEMRHRGLIKDLEEALDPVGERSVVSSPGAEGGGERRRERLGSESGHGAG